MESSLLSKLPFDPAYLLIFLVLCIIVLFVLLISIVRTQNKLLTNYRKFMRGKSGKSLENALLSCFDDMDQIDLKMSKIEKAMRDIDRETSAHLRKVGLVKYDAFQEMGGNLSFALTLLDKEDNGIIINTIHGREGCYEYIKEIVKGESFVALSDEEAESLKKALASGNMQGE